MLRTSGIVFFKITPSWISRRVRTLRSFTLSRAWASSSRCFACNSLFSVSIMRSSPLLPDNIVAQRVGHLHGLPILQPFPLQLAGEVENAVAPAVLVMQQANCLLHGVPCADNLRFNLVSDC